MTPSRSRARPRSSSASLRAREVERARAPKHYKTALPLDVLLAEALDVARFVEGHGKSTWKGKTLVRRGLDLANDPQLEGPIAREIRDLVREAQACQERVRASRPPRSNGAELMRRGRAAHRELRAVLDWLAHGDERRKEELRQVHAQHNPRTMDGLALALSDLAEIARDWTRRGRPVDGATPEQLAEVMALAKALRDAPPGVPMLTPPKAQTKARGERNQTLAVLADRVARVRAAAKYVWRAEPEVVREVTSRWERERKRGRAAGKTASGGDAGDAG